MLSNISWSNYIIGAILLLLVYYTIVAFLFYRAEILHLLRNVKPLPDKMGSMKERLGVNSIEGLKTVVADIRAILELAAKNRVSKDELLGQLADRLANFDGLHNTAYRIALSNYIINNAENTSGVAINEDELEVVFEGLPR
ncbi:hypothetical protein [Chitinophaga sp. OAE865]|uniref:hypothetical protein n=1 Tax=Chitinophaga sp. OAE865 TaxID=2817898 RepID=UPI001AE1B9DB